jgi:hypothetical protein
MRKTPVFSGKSVVGLGTLVGKNSMLYRVAKLTSVGVVNKLGGFYQTLPAVLPRFSHKLSSKATSVKLSFYPQSTPPTNYYYYLFN